MIRDMSLLQAAVIGYEHQIAQLRSEMDALIKRLGGRSTAVAGQSDIVRTRRLSAAARKRISAAQRKRWAQWKKENKRQQGPVTITC